MKPAYRVVTKNGHTTISRILVLSEDEDPALCMEAGWHVRIPMCEINMSMEVSGIAFDAEVPEVRPLAALTEPAKALLGRIHQCVFDPETSRNHFYRNPFDRWIALKDPDIEVVNELIVARFIAVRPAEKMIGDDNPHMFEARLVSAREMGLEPWPTVPLTKQHLNKQS